MARTASPRRKHEVRGPSGAGDFAAVKAVRWGRGFRMIDLFAGIGGMRLGFEAVGGRCVFSSEWDAEAQDSYEANFGERPHGDITQIEPEAIPEHDVLLAGFPCQPFSIIGDRKGFADTRGTLFFSIEEVLRAKRPAALLLENVKQFKTHDQGRTFATVVGRLAELGYFTHTAVLNALDHGVCQRRERTYIVGFQANLAFRFPKSQPRLATLEDVLEPDDAIDPKLWASPTIKRKRLARLREQGGRPLVPSIWHENKGGHIGMYPYSCALRANASYSYLLVNGVRRPSSRELLRLQGFPETYRIAVSHAALRKQTGNSVAVPVIRAIAQAMLESLQARVPAPPLTAELLFA